MHISVLQTQTAAAAGAQPHESRRDNPNQKQQRKCRITYPMRPFEQLSYYSKAASHHMKFKVTDKLWSTFSLQVCLNETQSDLNLKVPKTVTSHVTYHRLIWSHMLQLHVMMSVCLIKHPRDGRSLQRNMTHTHINITHNAQTQTR